MAIWALYYLVVVSMLQSCTTGPTATSLSKGPNTTLCDAGRYYLDGFGCQKCTPNTYKPLSGNHNCTKCPVDQHSRQSVTTASAAQISVQDCIFKPELVLIDPSYGPTSGGTLVYMQFAHLSNWTIDKFSWAEKDIAYDRVTGNLVRILSPKRPVPERARIDIWVNDNKKSEYRVDRIHFDYKKDPVVASLDRSRTIVSGGLLLTVFGENFKSVKYPKLIIIATYQHCYDFRFKSNCSSISNRIMTCLIPDLTQILRIYSNLNTENRTYHPDQVPMSPKLKQGCDPVITSNNHEEKTTPSLIDYLKLENGIENLDNETESTQREKRAARRLSRDARDSGSDWEVNHMLEFYIGFQLDGVKDYRNLSEIMPSVGKLEVFRDPELYQFQEKDNIKDFYPGVDLYLNIKGAHLDHALSVEDFTVVIGAAQCNVTFLATNYLTCKPPQDFPPARKPPLQTPFMCATVEVRIGLVRNYFIGYLRYCEEDDHPNGDVKDNSVHDQRHVDESVSMIPFLALGGAVLVCMVAAWITCMLWMRRKTGARRGARMIGAPYPANDAVERIYFSLSKLDKVAECIVDSARISIDVCIGEGHFGKVFKGYISNEADSQHHVVAIKTLHEHKITDRGVCSFLDEALIMRRFAHKNILSMYGICFKAHRALVILQYMDLGDLRSYVAKQETRVTEIDLNKFTIDVAEGMTYLSKSDFVHRDLAARNCMLDSSMTVKIADFGLSRDVRRSKYYRIKDLERPLPARWMALESLQTGKFTVKSDVWSFGILIWELYSRGEKPYPELHNHEIRSFLQMGRRLTKPLFASIEIYTLMEHCWDINPDLRPPFEDIASILERLLEIKLEDNPNS